jgi:cytochrome c-type biogenesis protein CcmE
LANGWLCCIYLVSLRDRIRLSLWGMVSFGDATPTIANKNKSALMMTQTQKKRLQKVITYLLLGAIVVGLILYALSQNLNLFYTPTDILTQPPLAYRTIRVGGMVQEGSVKRGLGLEVEFVLTDFQKQITIQYDGILPDLFREKQGIVVLGKYDPASKTILAEQVLAKHDENYMPPGMKKGAK